MPHDLFANAQLSPEQRRALTALQDELAEARGKIKLLEDKVANLEQQATTEHTVLTRPEFNREVARMLAFDERYGGTSSVLYFDVAGLDALTGRFGSPLASEAASAASAILTRHVRGSDIVGRLATDEFGVLLARCGNDDAWKKGRSLAALLSAALAVIDGKELGLDISFGAYTFREEEDVATGLKEAAHALTKVDKG
jgi:diguanylate cyclase (GGDEF)-like protein